MHIIVVSEQYQIVGGGGRGLIWGPPPMWRKREGGEMAFISKERESSGGEDATIPPSFMTYHDEVRTILGIGRGHWKTSNTGPFCFRPGRRLSSTLPRCQEESARRSQQVLFLTIHIANEFREDWIASFNVLQCPGQRIPYCQHPRTRRQWLSFLGFQFAYHVWDIGT